MLINNIFHVTFLFKTYKYILTLINGNVKTIFKKISNNEKRGKYCQIKAGPSTINKDDVKTRKYD